MRIRTPRLPAQFYQIVHATYRTKLPNKVETLCNGKALRRSRGIKTISPNRIGLFEETIEKGRDVVRRGTKASWFECMGRSGLEFWRWSKELIDEVG